MRETLDIYSKSPHIPRYEACTHSVHTDHALIQQRKILQMEDPNPVDIRNMQCLYDGASMGFGGRLLGPDRDIWGTILEKHSHSKELVVLRPRTAKDAFSLWLSAHAIPVLSSLGLEISGAKSKVWFVHGQGGQSVQD
jgi:hypothetical protein